MEPRIPKVEGFQFVSRESNAEVHYPMKSILLQPLYLPLANDDVYTKELRYLEAYKALCTAPQGHDRWPAQASGDGSAGPFERGWQLFVRGLSKKRSKVPGASPNPWQALAKSSSRDGRGPRPRIVRRYPCKIRVWTIKSESYRNHRRVLQELVAESYRTPRAVWTQRATSISEPRRAPKSGLARQLRVIMCRIRSGPFARHDPRSPPPGGEPHDTQRFYGCPAVVAGIWSWRP